MRIINLEQRYIKIILFYLILIATLIIYFGLFHSHTDVKIHGTYMQTPMDIEAFHLINQDGKPLTHETLKGRWAMVFFGFTHCPMICPTTLVVLNEMHKKLEQELPKNLLPQIVFISVDPDRDTVERLNQFVHLFNPHFIGARADTKEILALEKQLHLIVSSDNTVNHSMEIVLLNPEVQVQAYFAYPHQATQLVAEYKAIINKMA